MLGLFGQKKNDPHRRLETLERVSGWGTLVILFGILIEIWLFWRPDHYPLERMFTLAANVLIAIGLIMEYAAIRLTIIAAAEAQHESDARLTEALNRAANAEELLARLRRPRRKILKESGAQVTEAVKSFA